MRFQAGKVIFYASIIYVLCSFSFAIGLYLGGKQGGVYTFARNIKANLTSIFEDRVVSAKRPVHFLQPALHAGSGVTINKINNDDLILMTGFFDGRNGLRLIRRDGAIIANWPVSFSDHFPDASYLKEPPATDLNVDIHGALINPDGSVVFNYEYAGAVKLSRCNDVIWTLHHPTHHSIAPAGGGGYWIPGRKYLYPRTDGEVFPPFTKQGGVEYLEEDLILRVSEDGLILGQKSIPGILYENGLEPLLTSGIDFLSQEVVEIVHANQISELAPSVAYAFAGFAAGDLVISLRRQNLIFVVNPDTWKIKWQSTGPWRRQHDPEFDEDGTISVFNNNAYRLDLGPGGRAKLGSPRNSNIMKIDPASGEWRVVYGQRRGEEFLSVIRGKHDPTPDGGFLITEFQGGRIFEVNAERDIVWEYVNRYDEDEVLEVTEAKLYPPSYFEVSNWGCTN